MNSSGSSPFISICIPAYRRTHYLKRLLESIATQTFRNFEVIVSDDSGNDDSVEMLVKQFGKTFQIQYYKNENALGTPANWNAAFRQANGEWIKLMHDDDWFATEGALQIFADETKKGIHFICSGYQVVDDNGAVLRKDSLSSFKKRLIVKTPMTLLANNYIGQPSVTMVHRSVKAVYDERMKWRVDIDYYMQLLLSERKISSIPAILINAGVSPSQVTNSCLNVPNVELPEGWLLLEKYGTSSLRHILVYDAWWRLLRNTHTRSQEDLYRYASPWPKAIEEMVAAQSKIDVSQLQRGILSKLYMCLHFMKSMKRRETSKD